MTTPRVRTVACLSGVSLERNVPSEEIHEYLKERDNLVWVDVQDPGPVELEMLQEEFGFHALALDDIAKGHERPKVDEYKGHLFAVMYGVLDGAVTEAVRTVEIDLFIGRNFVVSVHRERFPALDDALARWMRGGAMLKEGVGYLVYTLVDAVIDTYAPVLDAIENDVEETELALFSPTRTDGVQALVKLKRTLIRLRRVLYPLRETFQIFLRPDHAYFAPGTRVYFQDVYQHILRILDGMDVERDLVSAALDANLTLVSNQLHQTM
ncbi:MAG TPA: magnesium transporter CorA family protein, partial [Planctomycetaceae bacterium]|nr:magnesium transporter CorA family protein [Planctomycetaceae bacterium]